MRGKKPLYLSKGIVGALLVVIATGAQMFGYEIGDPESWVTEFLILNGAILAIIGRVRAVKKIGKVKR